MGKQQKLLTEERFRAILELLTLRGAASIAEFAQELNISESTVRRDLIELDRQGRLIKVRGGATTRASGYTASDRTMLEKQTMNVQEKKCIARCASALIGPEDVVFLDAGSTTALIPDFLQPQQTLFVTNGIEHAQKLSRLGCHVIMLGGEIKPVTEAAIGVSAVEMLRQFHFTLAFLGTNGIGIRTGFTTPDPDEAAVKSTAWKQSRSCYVLADSSKFDVVAPVTFAPLSGASVIASAPDEIFHRYGAHTELLRATE